jgi:hypothetical protein
MAVTAKFYGKALVSAFSKKIDVTADSFKAMLCTSAYTPDQDAHQFKSDVTNEIAAGGGYTAGGAAITGMTITYDATTNTLKIDGGDVTWDPSTITARFIVVYDDTPATAATKPLICFVDLGQDVSSNAAPFTVQWNAAGIATLTVD